MPEGRRGAAAGISRALAQALAFLLIIASAAAAQPVRGTGGPGNFQAPVIVDGTTRSECPTILLTSGDLTNVRSSTGCTLAAGANVSEFGTCVGDVASEHCNPDHVPGAIDGGTATTDELELNGTSSTAPANSNKGVSLCTLGIDIASNGVNCMTIMPGAVTIGAGGILLLEQLGINNTTMVTQTASGTFVGLTPNIGMIGGGVTYQVTDDAIATPWNLGAGFIMAPTFTLKNATNDNWQGAILNGYRPIFAWTKSGTGTLAATKLTVFDADVKAMPSGVTLTDLKYFGESEPSGTLAGTLTTVDYFFAPALSKGTNRGQYVAAEMTEAGAPAAGQGWLNLVAGAPNRWVFTDESGFKFPTGAMEFVVSGTTSAGGTTFATPGETRAAAAQTSATAEWPIPGALHVYSMACGTNVAQGLSKTLVVTLNVGLTGALSGTAVTLTFSNSNTPTTFRNESGVAVATASGQLWNVGAALTAGGTAGKFWCTVTYALDAW